MEVVSIEIIATSVLSLLIGIAAYFLKQLLRDFKKVESDLAKVRNNTDLIQAEFQGNYKLLNQKVDFMNTRVSRMENLLYNIKDDEKRTES